jgi:hypothetical protein
MSNDVSLKPTLLNWLCRIITTHESHLASPTAFQAIMQAVTECLLCE